jgi:hypothetical protein
LHIWQRKEIENYLLVPSAILRVIRSKLQKEIHDLTEDRVRSRLEKIAEAQKDSAFDAISQEALAENRAKGTKFANEIARKRIDTAWSSLKGKLSVVSGKLLLSKLSEWGQNRFGVSLGARRLAREIRTSEIEPEMRNVILAIEQGCEFTEVFPVDKRSA